MFDKAQAIFTYTLSGTTLNVVMADGITAIAIKLLSGAGTYKGNKKIGAVDSTATTLVINNAVTITAEQTKYIDNLIIDALGGVIEIIAR